MAFESPNKALSYGPTLLLMSVASKTTWSMEREFSLIPTVELIQANFITKQSMEKALLLGQQLELSKQEAIPESTTIICVKATDCMFGNG